MKRKVIVTFLLLLLLLTSNVISVFANATINEQIGEQQINQQVEVLTPTAIGNTIANTFPDLNFAQVVADTVADGDVNAVLTQDMVDNCIQIDAKNKGIANIEGIDIFENLMVLYVAENQLTSVPESIGNLNRLQAMYLYNNQLTNLPESIGNLNKLLALQLYNNQLVSLPESIGNLSALQTLRVANNQLTSVPESTWNLSELRYLELDSNQLTSLSERVGKLSKLQTLAFASNQLTSVPESIGELSDLQMLILPNNQLTSIPESIGNLNKLQTLYLYNNQLTSLPESILNLTALTRMELANNLLPDSYFDYLTGLGINIGTGFQGQDKILIEGIPTTFVIEKQQDIDTLDYRSFLGVQGSTGVKEVSPTHQFILENYVDENNQPIDINDYIKNGTVINSGRIQAQVRAVGTGLFPNNSENAITSETITLQLSIPIFQLTFDLQGADSGSISPQSLEVGAVADKVTDPTKEGYAFKGWNTKSDGSGTPWNFTTSTMPASDVILYAQWEKDIVVVDPVKPSPEEPMQKVGSVATTGVQTGDNTNVILYITLGALALAGLAIVRIRKLRSKKDDKK